MAEIYLTKTPIWLPWLYPSLIWHKDRSEKSIYLSFDDGPTPLVTSFVLETLEKFNAKATFFLVGQNIVRYPSIFSDIQARGHQLGNHTFHHLCGWNCKDEHYIEDIEKCYNETASLLFRPPYGRIKRSQIAKLKKRIPTLEIIMWDVLSGDFDVSLSPENCLKRVIQHAENGSIIVFHDSVKAFPRLQYVLPKALAFWTETGYTLKAL